MITGGPFAFLPASTLFESGLRDLRAGRATVPALCLAMAWPRLEPLGLVTRALADSVRRPGEDLELTAYRLLQASVGQAAHGLFLALSAEVESALNALEREQRTRLPLDHSEQTISP